MPRQRRCKRMGRHRAPMPCLISARAPSSARGDPTLTPVNRTRTTVTDAVTRVEGSPDSASSASIIGIRAEWPRPMRSSRGKVSGACSVAATATSQFGPAVSTQSPACALSSIQGAVEGGLSSKAGSQTRVRRGGPDHVRNNSAGGSRSPVSRCRGLRAAEQRRDVQNTTPSRKPGRWSPPSLATPVARRLYHS